MKLKMQSDKEAWYVVYTHALKEQVAFANLANQDFKAYLPKIEKITKHARKVKAVQTPFFPRYLFVRFNRDADRWHKIKNTRGVMYLISNNDEPVPVPDNLVEQFLLREDDRGFQNPENIGLFTSGEQLKVVNGVFKDNTVTFDRFTDKVRTEVFVKFLNREMKISLPYYSLEKI